MTDLSPRETAARALHPRAFDPNAWPPIHFGQSLDEARAEAKTEALEDAARVLAAVAALDGLAEVLRAHTAWSTTGPHENDTWCVTCYDCCATLATYGPEDLHHREESDFDDLFADHLADVVRAWMVQP